MIKLGRDGNQPFTISAKKLAVSSIHAFLDYDADTGQLWLEDNNSTNGTFIRNDEGVFVRIGREQITPDTFILLGEDTALGCSFFAHQALDKVKDVFYNDFKYIKNKNEEFDSKLKRLEKKTKTIKICARAVVPLLIYGGFTLLHKSPEFRFIASMIGYAIVEIFDSPGKRRKIIEERSRWRRCPNPECNHLLSDEDVHNMQCSRCKAQ